MNLRIETRGREIRVTLEPSWRPWLATLATVLVVVAAAAAFGLLAFW
jgi:hypothetical protein